MTLFSYVVARDFGFAPNPFGGVCTLATCKPEIRRAAKIGDWIVGTGSAKRQRQGHLIYAMKVSESLAFEDYWNDRRFQCKKPDLKASMKLAYGDNIYHRDGPDWVQMNSHHSQANGAPNPANILRDTKADRVLIADWFVYWGGSGPEIPRSLRNFHGVDICKTGPGHRRDAPEKMIGAFTAWLQSLGVRGIQGRPLDW